MRVLLCGQKNQKPPPGGNRGGRTLVGLKRAPGAVLQAKRPRFSAGPDEVSPLSAGDMGGLFETLSVPGPARRSPSGESALAPRFPQGGKCPRHYSPNKREECLTPFSPLNRSPSGGSALLSPTSARWGMLVRHICGACSIIHALRVAAEKDSKNICRRDPLPVLC